MKSSEDYVHLRGGLTVPLAVLRVLWALEDRGICLTAAGDGIIAAPKSKLTDEDRAQIRTWRTHVLAVLTYDCDHHVH